MRKLFNQSAHEKSKKNEKTGENARTEEQSHGIREELRRAAEVLLIPVCALYMEIISKLRTFGELFQTDIVYMISLAAAMGFLFAAIPLLLPGKHRRRVFTGIMAAMSVLFSFHAIYFNSFHTFYSWNNLGQAGGATHFWREALIAAGGVWYVLIAFFVPTVAFGVFGKKLIPDDSKRTIPLAAVSFVLAWGLYIPSVLVIDSYKNSGDISIFIFRMTLIRPSGVSALSTQPGWISSSLFSERLMKKLISAISVIFLILFRVPTKPCQTVITVTDGI